MAMTDYGAILRVDGKIVNKNEFFMVFTLKEFHAYFIDTFRLKGCFVTQFTLLLS